MTASLMCPQVSPLVAIKYLEVILLLENLTQRNIISEKVLGYSVGTPIFLK